MIAGRLKYRLELLRPDNQESRAGQRHSAWLPTQTVWGERVRVATSREHVEARERTETITTVYRVRAVYGVRSGWRVRQVRPEGDLWLVEAVEDNILRGYVDLLCTKVNK